MTTFQLLWLLWKREGLFMTTQNNLFGIWFPQILEKLSGKCGYEYTSRYMKNQTPGVILPIITTLKMETGDDSEEVLAHSCTPCFQFKPSTCVQALKTRATLWKTSIFPSEEGGQMQPKIQGTKNLQMGYNKNKCGMLHEYRGQSFCSSCELLH